MKTCCQAIDKAKNTMEAEYVIVDPMIIEIIVHLKTKFWPRMKEMCSKVLLLPIRATLQQSVDACLKSAKKLHAVCRGGRNGEHWASAKPESMELIEFAREHFLKMPPQKTAEITKFAEAAEEDDVTYAYKIKTHRVIDA